LLNSLRSGNAEFKNFLNIAKGSKGEFPSQLYRCLDRRHILKEKLDELYQNNTVLGIRLCHLLNTCRTLALSAKAAEAGMHRTLKLRTLNIDVKEY